MNRAGPCLYLLLAIFVLAVPAAARAGSAALCSRLETKLANTSAFAGGSAKFRRYADAVAAQKAQLRKVGTDMTRFGCSAGSIIFWASRNKAACRTLSSAKEKMRANLATLEQKRDSYRRNGGAQARRQLEAALAANNCNAKAQTINAALSNRASHFLKASLRGPIDAGSRNGDPDPDVGTARIIVEKHSASSGNLQTMCVRTCDGYFFPVSSWATSADFGRDERACQMMCAGTDARLYYRSMRGQKGKDMISVRTHEIYSALPNAFKYRTVANPEARGCSCNIAAYSKRMLRREAVSEGMQGGILTKTQARGISGSSSPGKADEDARRKIETATAIPAERDLSEADRQVRMVGPRFLPDPSQKLDFTPNDGIPPK